MLIDETPEQYYARMRAARRRYRRFGNNGQTRRMQARADARRRRQVDAARRWLASEDRG